MSFIDLFWFSLIPLGGILFCYHFADLSSAHSTGQFFSSLIAWFLTGWFFVYIMLKYVLPMLIDLLDLMFPIRPKCVQCGGRGKDYRGCLSLWSKTGLDEANITNFQAGQNIVGRVYICGCGMGYFYNYVDNKFSIVISGDVRDGYLIKPWKQLKFFLFWANDLGKTCKVPQQLNMSLSSVTENCSLVNSYSHDHEGSQRCLIGTDYQHSELNLSIINGIELVKDVGWILALYPESFYPKFQGSFSKDL